MPYLIRPGGIDFWTPFKNQALFKAGFCSAYHIKTLCFSMLNLVLDNFGIQNMVRWCQELEWLTLFLKLKAHLTDWNQTISLKTVVINLKPWNVVYERTCTLRLHQTEKQWQVNKHRKLIPEWNQPTAYHHIWTWYRYQHHRSLQPAEMIPSRSRNRHQQHTSIRTVAFTVFL